MTLLQRRHWVFDLDGTLTVAVHDFDGLRARLGLPSGADILEGIAARPVAERPALHRAVEAWELELVAEARPAPGLEALLEALGSRRLGVLTRNTSLVARRTLDALGVAERFDPVVGRDQAEPKPAADGIRRILQAWGADPADALVVGDFRFDLEAGRAAGVGTVLVDALGHGRWRELADLVVAGLGALAPEVLSE